MRKKLAAAFIAAGFLTGLIGASPAQAACSNTQTAGPYSQQVDNPVTGGYIYADGDPAAADGFVGISGDTGYLEAGGNSSGGSIHGRANGTPVEGELVVSESPSLCLVGEQVV